MGQISKEGAGCFWTILGIIGISGGIQIIIEGAPLLGLLIIAGSILFIKYAGRAMWKDLF